MTGLQLVALSAQEVAERQQAALRTAVIIAVALFVAMALLARRRSRTLTARAPSRTRRIVETAAIWSVAYTAIWAPFDAIHVGLPSGLSGAFGLLLRAALFMVLALALVGAADLLLDALAPRHTPAWLLAGPLLIAAFAIGMLAASHWMDIFRDDPGWRETVLTAGLLIAGLNWWSLLPRPGADLSGIFD